MKIFNTNWIAILYLILLLVAALIPLGMGSNLNNNYTFHVRGDYLLHALFYIPLPVFLLLSRWGRAKGWLPTMLISLMVVALFEIVQMLVPYRAFNINDLFANGVGILIGWALYVILRNKLLKITSSAD